VDIVLQLFTDRTNQILITNFISSPYEISNGIDQGEVISPLLWICYYDPMFFVINQLPNPFSVSISKIVDINNSNLDRTISFNSNVVGYLDDTTWFADSIPSLELKLNIASDFYSMADIMVNFDKLKILSSVKHHLSPSSSGHGLINLTISNCTRSYQILRPTQAERILGIYVSGNSLLTPTIKKARSISYRMVCTLRYKKLSHQHILYIINRVVIPRLLYVLQSCFPL
jgi:Reverse transcriptase (RNA-dependent DNA polymerase)